MKNKAREFAIRAHGSQKYGPRDYVTHLDKVVAILHEFGYDDYVYVCAGYLHDTIEDTQTKWEDVCQEFGSEVADIVFAVTDEQGNNRHERHLKTYPKIAANKKATIVKLADRIANVRHSIDTGNKVDMYKKEYHDFKQALFTLENEQFWQVLDFLLEGKR